MNECLRKQCMKTAIDNYTRGKQKECNADEYLCITYPSSRFVCPECGESVFIRPSSKGNKFFVHHKKTDVSAECDRRVDGNVTESVYERIGLPMYLRKNESFYELQMGFKCLPEKILLNAQEKKISLIMDEKHKYLINQERFSSEKTTFIPVNKIPHSDENFRIQIQPSDQSILNYWSDYSDGFTSEGAIFFATETGGKKLRHGDTVSTGINYYWLRKKNELPLCVPGINMKIVGHLRCDHNDFNVFYGNFNENLSDTHFSLLSAYLRGNLKLYLLEKQPEFIPIWPPVIKTNDGYKVTSDTKEIWGSVISGNEVPKIYSFHGCNSVPIDCKINNQLSKVSINDKLVYVNIDRKFVSSGAYFFRGTNATIGHSNQVYLKGNDSEDILKPGIHINDQKSFMLSEDNRNQYYKLNDLGQIEDITSKLNSYIPICNSESIYIIQNGLLRYLILSSIAELKQENNLTVEELMKILQRYQSGSHLAKIPTAIKQYFLENNKRWNNILLAKLLLEDEVPCSIIKIMGDYMNGRTI